MQVAAPTPLKLPAAQGEHALEDVPDLKDPALHGLQAPAPATLEELPGPQLEHEVAPASEKVPGVHMVVQRDWPNCQLAVPAGQLEQAAAPALELVPGRHEVQNVMLAAALEPAAHGVHTCVAVNDVMPG